MKISIEKIGFLNILKNSVVAPEWQWIRVEGLILYFVVMLLQVKFEQGKRRPPPAGSRAGKAAAVDLAR